MLGIGGGTISQSFFIDMCMKYVEKSPFSDSNQMIYEQLFFYFRSFQLTFPEDWPVPVNDNIDTKELDDYSKRVLVILKSQLVKTNGFGAIMRAFPIISQKS